MTRSDFYVAQMDCAAEEQLIRMKLGGLAGVHGLRCDVAARQVQVFHGADVAIVQEALASLQLGSRFLGSESIDSLPEDESTVQRRVLWLVLIINLGFFVLELSAGLLFNSMGLVADSLDMLADALVYSMSLVVVGQALARKRLVARLSGYFQILLALVGFLEVLRRFLGFEQLPDYRVMILVSFLALLANGYCLYLLWRSRSSEAHMRASMIFTSNDVIINLGVIVAGFLVLSFNSAVPDLIVGGLIFVLVMWGALRILRLARG